jgi:hypothetical protein
VFDTNGSYSRNRRANYSLTSYSHPLIRQSIIAAIADRTASDARLGRTLLPVMLGLSTDGAATSTKS